MRILRQIECFIFGHRYEVWQELTPHSRRVICDHCAGDWGMNDDVQAFIPWCADLESLYRSMGKRIRTRNDSQP